MMGGTPKTEENTMPDRPTDSTWDDEGVSGPQEPAPEFVPTTKAARAAIAARYGWKAADRFLATERRDQAVRELREVADGIEASARREDGATLMLACKIISGVVRERADLIERGEREPVQP